MIAEKLTPKTPYPIVFPSPVCNKLKNKIYKINRPSEESFVFSHVTMKVHYIVKQVSWSHTVPSFSRREVARTEEHQLLLVVEKRELLPLSVFNSPPPALHSSCSHYNMQIHFGKYKIHWVIFIHTYMYIGVVFRNVNLFCCIHFSSFTIQNNIFILYNNTYNRHIKKTPYQSFHHLLENKFHNKNKFYVFFLLIFYNIFSLFQKTNKIKKNTHTLVPFWLVIV